MKNIKMSHVLLLFIGIVIFSIIFAPKTEPLSVKSMKDFGFAVGLIAGYSLKISALLGLAVLAGRTFSRN